MGRKGGQILAEKNIYGEKDGRNVWIKNESGVCGGRKAIKKSKHIVAVTLAAGRALVAYISTNTELV